MIRNSTRKFKEKYAYSSVKKLQVLNNDREESEASQKSVRFNTTLSINHTKSTPKLQNSKRLLLRTQPLLRLDKSKIMDEKYSVFTSHTEIETIQTIMKKRGIDQDQIQHIRTGKLKKVNRNSHKIRNSQDFIQKLPKNSLFFCCECFQYIFDIEKHRHFPDCKDQINKSIGNTFQIGRKKLQKLVQLANYTQTNADQINDLYSQYLSNKYDNIVLMSYPKYNFFTLKEIKYAFAYIFDQLLKNAKQENDSTFFSCF